MNFKQYTIALLIILFCAGSVIVGIRSALTSETSDYTSLPDKEQGFVEYQGSPYSTVYYSAPAQGTAVAVPMPMRSVNSGILRHPQASYYAGRQAVNSSYASQGLTTTAHQAVSSYGTFTGGGSGYNVARGSANYTRGGSAGYAVAEGQRTMVTPTMIYTGETNQPLQVGGQHTLVYYAKAEVSIESTGQSSRGGAGESLYMMMKNTASTMASRIATNQRFGMRKHKHGWMLLQ